MNYRDYVGKYDDMEPVQPSTNQYNFSFVLINDVSCQ